MSASKLKAPALTAEQHFVLQRGLRQAYPTHRVYYQTSILKQTYRYLWAEATRLEHEMTEALGYSFPVSISAVLDLLVQREIEKSRVLVRKIRPRVRKIEPRFARVRAGR